MASPTRNPKDLKTIISSNQTGDTLPTTSYGRLQGLEGDKYEIEMLRSRIEEQGQLICIIKKRADEFMIRNQTLEKINDELELLRAQASEEAKSEAKKSEMLEMRFNELAENHEEMIKFKDEHKRRNQLLMEQNANLLKENKTLFSSAIEEKDAMIKELKSSIRLMKRQLQDAISEHEAEIAKLKDSQVNANNKLASVEEELKLTRRKLKLAEDASSKAKAERDVAKSQQDDALLQVKKENDLLLEQVMQRGKLLQERQSDIEKLEKEIQIRDEELEEAEEKFHTMEDRVNVNSRVKKLQAERDVVDSELSQLRREYEAFKVHSNKLLSQEKDLNYKLRKNITT